MAKWHDLTPENCTPEALIAAGKEHGVQEETMNALSELLNSINAGVLYDSLAIDETVALSLMEHAFTPKRMIDIYNEHAHMATPQQVDRIILRYEFNIVSLEQALGAEEVRYEELKCEVKRKDAEIQAKQRMIDQLQARLYDAAVTQGGMSA